MKLRFVPKEEFFSVYNSLTDSEIECAHEYIDSDFDFGGFEVLCGYTSGCLIFRYFSEEAGYHFDAPFTLAKDADIKNAFLAISEYCKREGIAETVVGIEKEYKDVMLRGAENYAIAEDEDGTLAIRINTECMMLDSVPEVMVDDVYLGEFAARYADSYEKLVKNVNLNRYFGYNMVDDIPEGKGRNFIEAVRQEFENGESITLAATVLLDGENVFVGEGCLYAFDGRGSAAVSFRVLPEWHSRGIGTKIFKGMMQIAKNIGLSKIIGEVKTENKASVALLSKFGKPTECGEKISFAFLTADF